MTNRCKIDMTSMQRLLNNSNLYRKIIPKSLTYDQNCPPNESTQSQVQIYETSANRKKKMKFRGCVFGLFPGGPGGANGVSRDSATIHFGTIFHSNQKRHPKRRAKINADKKFNIGAEIDAQIEKGSKKGMPKMMLGLHAPEV